MTMAGVEMDEGLLNDLLECSVCLERLDTSSRVLPCQHTFCIQCLREIIYCQKELRCPECRVLVETPVEELPPNVLLMRILEGMRNAGGQRAQTSSPLTQPIPRRPIIGPATFMEPVSSYGFTYSDGDGKHTNVIPKSTPHARALYDYFSKEPCDLIFKKDEVIILRRQIDTYWYHGETNGNQGVFPITFAKIIVPLPPQIPQCTALYDFHMAAHEEEGCLAFNKGATINVIRRVDENWAEGRLHDKIGIFPIAFVEMNGPALSVINSISSNSERGNSSSSANKIIPRSNPALHLNKVQQLNYGQKHAVRTAVMPNQVGFSQQQMTISSPVPNMGMAVQRQQHNMSQSHPIYLHQQQFHRTHENNLPAAQYVDLLEFQAGPQYRNVQSEPVVGEGQSGANSEISMTAPIDSRGNTSNVASSADSANQNSNKSRGTNTKFSNLSSSYHPTNNLSSDSSSTTTTPSFGNSSVTTTPNTSSNTSSASESNTPSSPASPATGALQTKAGANIVNNQQKIVPNQSPNQNNYSNISQPVANSRNVQGNESREEPNGSYSNVACEVSLDGNSANVSSASISTGDTSYRNLSHSSNNSQISNGNVLNATPPRSNMSSPQTCLVVQNNSAQTPSNITNQLESLQINNQSNNKNSSPNQNTATNMNISKFNSPRADIQASSSNQIVHSLMYNINDKASVASPRHSDKEGPLSSKPRISHSHHREKEKRNSLTAGSQIAAQSSINRRSAEILGSGSLLDSEFNHERMRERERIEKNGTTVEKSKEKERNKKSLDKQHSSTYPAYVALYAYKPQKPDELELKKGGIYLVMEQCQDGWFKGCSSRTQKSGVFPGNYVIPVWKAQQMSSSMNKSKHPSPSQQGASDMTSVGDSSSRTKESSSNHGSSSKSKSSNEPQPVQFQKHPPDLPPRAPSPGSSNSSFPWSSPKYSSPKSNEKSKEKSKVEKVSSSGVSLMKRLAGMKKSRSPPPSSTFSMDNPVFEDCTPERSDAAPVGHGNLQTIHTRSGSCPSQLLQGTPSSGIMNAHMLTMPHHYQNNENIPLDNTIYGTQLPVGGSVSSAVAHRLFPSHHMIKGMGSQTLGPSHGLGPAQRRQPRPTVLNALSGFPDVSSPAGANNAKQGHTIGRSGDVPWLPVSTRHHHHRKSHSLDAGQQLKSGKENTSQPINKRFRCIVAYPPNSEYELELQVDDVILVHKQWGEGWYKGTLERTGHTGLVPASFVESC